MIGSVIQMTSNGTELERWLYNTAAQRTDDLRIGLVVAGNRIQRQQLQTLVEDESKANLFSLEPTFETETRYRYGVTNEDQNLIQYQRILIDVSPDEFPNRETQLVIETTTENGASFTVPRSTVDHISADCLLDAHRRRNSQLRTLWSNRVAGLDEEKTRIKEFLTESLTDWGLRDETGMLLSGPPGTGKTELVKTACEELYGDIPETISGPEVLSRWVGESEATLRRTFKRARESPVPVLYIDEVDAIGASRAESTQDYTAQVVSQLLVLLDGIETKEDRTADSSPLKIIASTNTAERLDPALTRPGRLGDHRLTFTRPDAAQRYAIFHHYLERIDASAGALSPDLENIVRKDPTQLSDSLVDRTENYTGADIEHVVLVAARDAIRSNSHLTLNHLEAAYCDTTDELPTEAVDARSSEAVNN